VASPTRAKPPKNIASQATPKKKPSSRVARLDAPPERWFPGLINYPMPSGPRQPFPTPGPRDKWNMLAKNKHVGDAWGPGFQGPGGPYDPPMKAKPPVKKVAVKKTSRSVKAK